MATFLCIEIVPMDFTREGGRKLRQQTGIGGKMTEIMYTFDYGKVLGVRFALLV